MKRKDFLTLLAGLIVGGGLGVLVYFGFGVGNPGLKAQTLPAGREVSDSPSVGKQAPDFELLNLAGEKVKLSDARGKVVLINFWATWCGPCRLEMPAIQERFERNESRLSVFAVNFDEPVEDVRAFIDELGLTFQILLDPGAKVQNLYRVRGYPTTFLVDQDGMVRIQHLGFMSEDQLDRYLMQLGIDQ